MELQAEIDKIRSSLSAGVEARLRDQEKKEKIIKNSICSLKLLLTKLL